MSVFSDIDVEVEIVLGTTKLPIRQILKMGRGAIISLDTSPSEPSGVLVNGRMVARGNVLVQDEQMSLEVTEIMERSAK